MSGTHLLVFLALYFLPRLLTILPNNEINLRNRDFWLRPENCPEVRARLQRCLWRFGTAVFIFRFYTGLLTMKANLRFFSNPVKLDEGTFLMGLICFFGCAAYWSVTFKSAFRFSGRGRAE